jgi:acyl carrier protein
MERAGRVATMDIASDIREFVARDLLFSEAGFPHSDDVSFLQEGIIDSLGVLELVTFAGRQFGITVDPHEVTPENFDSVNRLTAYIRRKQGTSPPAGGLAAEDKSPC